MSIEVEAHHLASNDSFGKMIGTQTAILAVLLSIFTIFSHQAHTETIVLGNEASNQWSHYQAKRIRDYQLEMNIKLLQLTAPGTQETKNTIAEYSQQSVVYKKELAEIKTEAERKVEEGGLAHRKAGYFDLSEGFLEIAMILSSLYFLSRKKFFPMLGLLLGIAGTVIGVLGLLLHH